MSGKGAQTSNLKHQVMIVDDDYMTTKLYARYVAQLKEFKVIGITHTYEQTISRIKEFQPDLILLDLYLPDRSGIEVLQSIRTEKIFCDVIPITAITEINMIEKAFLLGVFDYLIKPLDQNLLKESLKKYVRFKSHIYRSRQSSVKLNQEFVENLKKFRGPNLLPTQQTQKLIDASTLAHIKNCLAANNKACTMTEIALLSGLSVSTIRAYLDYLIAQELVKEYRKYGAVGRPRRFFELAK